MEQLRSNIPELIAKLEKVKAAMGSEGNPPSIPDFSDAMLSALNAGMGKFKFRIFNKGLDADGASLGKYVRRGAKLSIYEKKRTKSGRQIGYKDLEFEGSLRRSIEVAKVDNSRVVMAITNSSTADIAGWQERQVGKIRGGGVARIFEFSETELEKITEEGNAAIMQVIEKLLNE